MCQRGGQGGHVPPQILADQKAPPAGGGAPHYCVPPKIFRRWHMPEMITRNKINVKNNDWGTFFSQRFFRIYNLVLEIKLK